MGCACRIPRFVAGSLLFAVCACAPGLRDLRGTGLPGRADVAGVPVVVQTEHHCGPAALSGILAWAGKPETPEVLSALTYTPGRSGTLPIDLPREIRARGLLAYRPAPRFEALLAELAAGQPVLILENRGLTWVPLWHYSVVAGYDLNRGTATLFAGGSSPESVGLSTLSRTWTRGGSFALLALPPGRLPAADDPEGILAALADLEESRQSESAIRGYESFLRRWPESWKAAFGWGNALHATGSDRLAEEAFRRAHGTAPERPEPLNNLALLALARGNRREARALAQQALENARGLGLSTQSYEDTLQQTAQE